MKTTAKKRYATPAMEMVMLQHQVCLMQGTTTTPSFSLESYRDKNPQTQETQYESDLGW